ncbi:MAG: hypothetical protein HQ518_15390 [Rhodopirellula sp.]|nr:hypothetical protein [Rhodopirellula sp.]
MNVPIVSSQKAEESLPPARDALDIHLCKAGKATQTVQKSNSRTSRVALVWNRGGIEIEKDDIDAFVRR